MIVWEKILNGNYSVSNTGLVRSEDRFDYSGHFLKGKPMKISINTDGYQVVSLSLDGVRKQYKIHRLVYETFIGEIHDGMQVNHIDEDKTNNFVFVNPDGSVDLEKSNLNLMTPKENINWGTRNKKVSEKLLNRKDTSKKIKQFAKNGALIETYDSIAEILRKNNDFDRRSIMRCIKGEKKYKTHKGFIWRAA